MTTRKLTIINNHHDRLTIQDTNHHETQSVEKNKPIIIKITIGNHGYLIRVVYGPETTDGWMIGIAPIDDVAVDDGISKLNWPISYGSSRTTMTIAVHNDAVVTTHAYSDTTTPMREWASVVIPLGSAISS